MKYLLFILILFTFSCSKQQTILICGDHECINKKEANQYFEENLTLEVQIISKEKKSRFDLVDLNISGEEPDIKVFKSENKKVVKKLSKEEIKIKKQELNNKKRLSKLKIEKDKKTPNLNKNNIKVKKQNKSQVISTYRSNNSAIDICLQLKKCDIDSIANYLIKLSNEKDFPNISIRE